MTDPEKALEKLIDQSGREPRREILKRSLAYLGLLEKWNIHINLVSSTEWHVVGPLFEDAFWASRFYPPQAKHHLDIGSGAGFPAIVLKVLIPSIQLDLVESRSKKAVFLETLANELELDQVRIHRARLGDFLMQCEPGVRWDCISWQAIKLDENDLRMLLIHARPQTQFWMFHGRELAIKESKGFEGLLKLYRQERCPGAKHRAFSVFMPQ